MIRRALFIALIAGAQCAFAKTAHLDLSVEINPATGELHADAQITPAPSSRFEFSLAEGLAITDVELDGDIVALEQLSTDKFAVEISDRTYFGTLVIRYGGKLSDLNAALSHRDVLQSLPPMASIDGSFLPAGSGWYPDPGRSFTYRLTIRTPGGHIAVAPGTPARESDGAVQRLSVIEFMHPTEGIDLMIGPYKLTERSIAIDGKRIRLRTYFHPGLESFAQSYLDASAAFILRYSREIDAYPYSDFSVVSSPLPTGFGMPTLTYLGREVLRLPFIRDISLGHEVLHNWWGNGVLVDSSRGNWSEGLTTFMADYAYKEDAGPGAAREMRHGWLRDLSSISPDAEEPLSAFRARQHVASSAIGYGKAAMLFFTLRESLGRERFQLGLRSFWRRHQFKEANFDDLRRAFERVSGLNLDAFFAQWLDRTGAPDIRIRQATVTRSTSNPRLSITIAQDLADRAARVPIRILHDQHHHDALVEVNGPSSTLALDVAPGARAVQLDPEFTVWRRLAPSESPPILRDAVAAPQLGVLVLDDDLKIQAMRFAAAFGEGDVRAVSLAEAAGSINALLVIGHSARIDEYLHARKLPGRPEQVSSGDIQSWAIAYSGRRTVMVALPGGKDAASAALAQLARRLHHLSRYSWVTFKGNQIAGRGYWPAATPSIPVH